MFCWLGKLQSSKAIDSTSQDDMNMVFVENWTWRQFQPIACLIFRFTFDELTAAKMSDMEFPGVNFLELERLTLVLSRGGLILDCLLDVLLRDKDLPLCDSCLRNWLSCLANLLAISWNSSGKWEYISIPWLSVRALAFSRKFNFSLNI